MNVISSVFWGEGVSDDRFLPKLIQRTLETVLFQGAKGEWEVLEPYVMKSNENTFVDQVRDISHKSVGFTLVFVHTDADAKDENQKALPFKINPALLEIDSLESTQH
jgi:hypothetical protein